MNLINKSFLPFIFVFLFFHSFASTGVLVANDWPLLFKESRSFSPFWALAWDYMGNGGIGSPAFKTLWIDLYTNLTYAISNSVNLPWWLSQRLFWILPFVLISLFSSYKFAGLFIKEPLFRVLSSIIYSFNTYILLIVGGGQFGIAFSFALAPLAIYALIKFFNNFNIKSLIYSSLVSGFLIALDPRISFLVFLATAVWYLVFIRNFSIKALSLIILNFSIAILLNSYWIIPILTVGKSLSDISSYTSLEGVKFLSFANFSNSISLLHPNWPENIFGKTYFLRSEFLLIPIFAFGILLLKIKKEILFFGVLALIGVFLGKGTNEPFGVIYSSLFQHVPGFNLFRDSTKFFIFVVLSYSILIPYFLENFKKFKYLLTAIFIIYWLLILKPAWSGELAGIFKPKEIPQEYLLLNESIKKDDSFYRTLWIPQRQKYGYFDHNHPAASAQDFFKLYDHSQILKNLRIKDTQKLVEQSAVKYVMVPYDSEGEIFLDDRKYSEGKRIEVEKKLDQIPWLARVRLNDLNHLIAVYEVRESKDHFWSPSEDLKLKYIFINPTEYKVQIQDAKKGDILVFSEGFDKSWVAESLPARNATQSVAGGKFKVQSLKFNNSLNSFRLPQGDLEFRVYYEPQRWVNAGLVISSLTALILTLSLFVISYRK